MMKSIRLTLSAIPLLALALASEAHAIPLPDNSTCSPVGGGQCLRIAATSGIGIKAEGGTGLVSYGVQYGVIASTSATGGGIAVYGNSSTGTGVYGTANSVTWPGVYGSNNSGNGVYGVSANTGSSGVYASNTSNGGFGVAGRVVGSGTGIAVYGDGAFSATTWAGKFDGRVGATSYVTTSDARMKTDVQASAYGLDTLGKLRSVTYKWKDAKHDQTRQVGLIAQEVQKIIPELVSTDANTGMLSVNYQGMVPVLIKAVQDQQQVIKAQEDRIAKLEKLTQRPLQAGMGWLALGLLPLGAVAAYRRRRTG